MVGYRAMHYRVVVARGNASEFVCSDECGKQAQEWAHIHDTDPEVVDNYRPLCVSCHRVYDGNGRHPHRKPKTPEHRAKLSESRRAAWARRREGEQ